jgi:hypothetical protein
MYWKILIVVLLLQIPLGLLVGRWMKPAGAFNGLPRELRNTMQRI